MRKIVINWNGVLSYKEENTYKIPEKAGVYEILEYNENTNKYIRRYVGSADNLHRRSIQHLSSEEENGNIRNGVRKYICGFDYALIENEYNYLDAEQGLYDKHVYSWNQKRPEGSGNYDYEIVEI